jgi:hypothetical protein
MFVGMLLISPRPVLATQPGVGNTTQQLINDLNRLIQKGQRERLASPQFLNQLRNLTRRYDWPWRNVVLFDNFRDGDFTRNPVWTSEGGEFRVIREGLRSRFRGQPVRGKGGQDTKGVLLELLLDQVAKDGVQAIPADYARIHASVRTGNAFAVIMDVTSMSRQQTSGQLEWGLSEGKAIDSAGYRLVYYPGTRPAIELQRISRGHTSIVESYERGNLLEDGRKHQVIWQRRSDGSMIVYLDKRQIMRTVDRGVRGRFGQFSIINRGGDYIIHQVSVSSIR